MLRQLVAASAVVALLAPASAEAQDITALCEKARRPPVGAWSEFKWVGGRQDGATVRLSIVGSERREGAQYLWMEMMMRGFPLGPERQQGERNTRMISKVLIESFGPGTCIPHVSIIKFGDNPAMEMPAAQSRMATQGAPTLRGCRDAKVIGWESVTVPAGTFRAIHIKNATGSSDSWVAPDLPFALVKELDSEDGQSRQMLLIGHGMGARTQITERPRPWDPRAFMQMVTGRTPPGH